MPFTTFKDGKIVLGGAGNGDLSYFHPEDISVILSQPGAMAVEAIRAKVGVNPTIECVVLIAVQFDKSGQITSRFTSEDHLAALPCPPYTREGGEFFRDPKPAPTV